MLALNRFHFEQFTPWPSPCFRKCGYLRSTLLILLLGCGLPGLLENDNSPTMIAGDHTHYHVHGAKISHDHSHEANQSQGHTHEHVHQRDIENAQQNSNDTLPADFQPAER